MSWAGPGRTNGEILSARPGQRRANGIKNNLNKVEYHQALLRAHEARDRAVMGANFDRVTFWSVTHTLVMIGVAGVQVFMIRSLFEDNSKIGKVLRKGKFD
uniref:GOLD domain-containing protein n=1 Tax=Caenorhabditis japonica TaxID=281687 RepID=A0A8R1J0M6_CAEJA